MFDYNPFREYKEMMKAKKLAENYYDPYSLEVPGSGGGGTTPQQGTPISGLNLNQPPRGERRQPIERTSGPEYKSWNIVTNPESTSDELHGAIDHYEKYGARGGGEIRGYDPNIGKITIIGYDPGISPESFYKRLQKHGSFNDTHLARIPEPHRIQTTPPTPPPPTEKPEEIKWGPDHPEWEDEQRAKYRP